MVKARVPFKVVFALLALGLLAGCARLEDYLQDRRARQAFQQACPEPAWWDEVETDVHILTYDGLLRYWQDDDRAPEQFFKAAYRMVLDHPRNDVLVVEGINLMTSAVRDYQHRQAMLEFAVEHYFDYDRSTEHYLGKSGDSMAGIVRDLARLYNAKGEHGKTVELVARLLAEREGEINDQMLELLHLPYAEALHRAGRTEDALAALDRAIETYDGDWEERLRQLRDRLASS